MRRHEETHEAWISSIKSIANSVHPPSDLKRRLMEQIEMRNEKGELLASIRIDSFQEDDVMDAVIRDLKPGMGKAIYVAGGERTVSQQTNYESVKWDRDIKALIELASPLQPSLPVDANLQDIHVYYGFENVTEAEIDDMVTESERSGKQVIVRDLHPNGVLVGIKLLYSKGDRPFELRIFRTTKSRIHVPDIDQHTIEHLTVRGNQAVYVADSERQQLIWAEEEPEAGSRLQYEILAERSNRDWLVIIAESLIIV